MVLLDLGLGRDLAPSWAPLGAAVLLLLVLLLLFLSMRRHLKRAARFAAEDGLMGDSTDTDAPGDPKR